MALCGAELRQRTLLVDRKFHSGMLEFARRIGRPLACVLPALSDSERLQAIDHVEVPLADLTYEVRVMPGTRADADIPEVLGRAIEEAALVCVGSSGALNVRVAELCRARGVRYVAVSETTLRTELDIMRSNTKSRVRRIVRGARLRALHRQKLAAVANAAELHANGYPTYLELGRVAPSSLLFFDTRASSADVVPEAVLQARLESLGRRPPRLLFTGRFHPIKGALDVVKVGLELDRRGVEFRLDLFGAGPLKDEMVALLRSGGVASKVAIHEPVPYRPDLIEVARGADLFVSCHVQGDPSCTYLETFACGVPIAGYANEMWSELCRDSGGGRVVPAGDVAALAQATIDLLSDVNALREAAFNARRFAAARSMETAWAQRAERLSILADEAENASARLTWSAEM
ncbi:MAG: glycosyltransferase [Anaeromyxobacteraceae bacterium]